MKKPSLTLRELILVALITFVPVCAVYVPFALNLTNFLWIDLQDSGMRQIYANWDGPNYVLNAITLYDSEALSRRLFMTQSVEYYPAHFPLFSWLIRLASPLGGYFVSGVITTQIASYVLNLLFYRAVQKFTRHALFLTFAFTVFPARYLIVRSVISPETLMIFFLFASVLLWERKRFILAGVCGMLSVMTKFQAIFLIGGIGLYEAWQALEHKNISRLAQPSKIIGLVLVGAGYMVVALYYFAVTGNVNAYFTAQNTVGMGARLPLSMFNYQSKWVGTGWLEDVVFYFAMAVFATIIIWGKNRLHACFVGFYSFMMTLIPQHDIMRLMMPIFPFVYLNTARMLEHKAFRYGLIALVPIIYLFTVNFIMTNRAPIGDWSLFK
jgi:hypothetical protein